MLSYHSKMEKQYSIIMDMKIVIIMLKKMKANIFIEKELLN